MPDCFLVYAREMPGNLSLGSFRRYCQSAFISVLFISVCTANLGQRDASDGCLSVDTAAGAFYSLHARQSRSVGTCIR